MESLPDPALFFRGLVAVVAAMAVIELGIAFLWRAVHEAGDPEGHRS